MPVTKIVDSNNSRFEYPLVRKDECIVDDFHGKSVCDPYRWMEDPDCEEVKKFVDDQNRVSIPFLESCPVRNEIRDRLTQLWNFEKYSCPFKEGSRYFYFLNTGLQNQSVMYVQDSIDGTSKEFFDPNKLSEDGTVAISSYSFSEDGETFAYALSESGSDWVTIHFKDVATGKDYDEVLKKVKFSGIEWTKDNKGIFYGRYPEQEGKTDGSETTSNEHQKLYYHRLGTDQSEDTLIVEFPEHPKWRVGSHVSDCGKYLIVTPQQDCRDNLVYYAHLDEALEKGFTGKLSLQPVITKFESDYDYVTNEGSVFYFRTNKGAPNYRVIGIDLKNPEEANWTTLIAEHSKDVIDWVCCVDQDKLIVCYIQDVKNTLEMRKLQDGSFIRQFPLEVGTIMGFSGKKKQSEIFFKFTSFLTPGIIYRVDLKSQTADPEIFRQVKVANFDDSLFTTTQVFYDGKDGTKIPMFIVHKKNLVKNADTPCLLYGYGGFNVSVQPGFSVTRLVFMQHLNGMIAIPNIRGGGEYGEKWHNEGRLLNKQNCFDDFQSAAEYLINEQYTKSSLLTIQGASNGGLLVGACINQRPDLFGAAIAQVGVMDMLRFHRFTIGYAWCSDYGNAEKDSCHFENVFKFSPIHNVRMPKDESIQYPSVLLLTADHDDRVVPLHSYKFIAELQSKIGTHPRQTNPLMIRIETKAGHGAGKPTAKVIEEHVDIMSFLVQTLGLKFTN